MDLPLIFRPSGRSTPGLVRSVGGVLLTVAAVVLLTGCQPSAVMPPHGAPPCGPPAYVLEPSSVKAGSTLKVSAPDATCDPRYGERAQIQLEVLDSRNQVLFAELAPMGDAGSFDHVLRIPADTKPGSYGVSATPHDLDWCDDTGRNNRVGSTGLPQSGTVIVRASCAMPLVSFTVTP